MSAHPAAPSKHERKCVALVRRRNGFDSHRRLRWKEVMRVQNIEVGRYEQPEAVGYQGWIEPADRSWIVFIDLDGKPVVFDSRTDSGAVA